MLTQCHVALQTDFFVNSDLEIKHSLIGNLKDDGNLRVHLILFFGAEIRNWASGSAGF